MAYDPTPLPRRKSCEACKKAKRRCDLGLPACSRCIHRKVACVYPWRQPPAFEGLNEAPSSIGHPMTTQQSFSMEQQANDPSFPQLSCSPALTELVDSLLENHNDWDHALHVVPDRAVNVGPYFALTIPRARQPRPLPEIIASNLQFAIDILKDTPKTMVLENQTPWCHQKLYQNHMPRAMQDAFSCCSLYMSKNETNAPVIMALFDARIKDIISTPEPDELLDKLARVHALILYQIMRLFDGDIRSHATADALFASLNSSVVSLLSHLHLPLPSDSLQPLPVSIDSIIGFWNSWVVQESARRTVLLAFFFMQIYKVLQGNVPVHCDGRLGLEHSWYLSAHLWSAQSAFDFAVAWAEKPHFVVHNLDFSWALTSAQPVDLDQFGRMLLVTLLGIDSTRAWFHGKGATFP
ncbi:hypothetical protein N7456_009135 [Penicillium angulare]|uniref:Zn(2)-C6 fungal-type domain-containing protein n=1 Tax=Penicillium angulare TaxID=116970 RepID=A0A9W9F4B0_9EURO|nr:hypothetical protein N7456_009135 [Penicillium angulare]